MRDTLSAHLHTCSTIEYRFCALFLTVNVLVALSSEHHLSDRFANVSKFQKVITVLKYQIN